MPVRGIFDSALLGQSQGGSNRQLQEVAGRIHALRHRVALAQEHVHFYQSRFIYFFRKKNISLIIIYFEK